MKRHVVLIEDQERPLMWIERPDGHRQISLREMVVLFAQAILLIVGAFMVILALSLDGIR